jgi:zinc transport system ATP-binding protein
LTPTQNPEPLVTAAHVSVRRGSRVILDDVSLTIGRGEIVSLIGPNGGGKSTLVKALLGLLPPDSGTVTRQPGLKVGYVPQRLPLDSTLPLPVWRFMTLTRRAPAEAIRAGLAETGVDHLYDRQLESLSGGEFQRVALARALLHQPDWLVLDEPVQGVDFAGEADLYRLIAEIRDRHRCGILLVSHDLHVVMAATDHVICLNQHVCCAGRPETVSRDAAYQRLFGPRGELALYTHHHDHTHGLGGGGAPADHHHDHHDHHNHHNHHHHDHAGHSHAEPPAKPNATSDAR